METDEPIGAHHLIFTPGSDRLIIATVDSRILVCSVSKWESGDFEVLCEFKEHRDDKSNNSSRQIGTITSMTVSADGQWLVTADHLNRINVFNMDNLKVCTSRQIQPALDGPHLVLLTSFLSSLAPCQTTRIKDTMHSYII
jgi:hypothetical protein